MSASVKFLRRKFKHQRGIYLRFQTKSSRKFPMEGDIIIQFYIQRTRSRFYSINWSRYRDYIKKIFKKENIPSKWLDTLTTYVVVSTIIGARLGHFIFYEPEYFIHNPIQILKIWEGGLASHGAAIGILIALLIFSRKINMPYLWILDRIVIVVALAGLNFATLVVAGHPWSITYAFGLWGAKLWSAVGGDLS